MPPTSDLRLDVGDHGEVAASLHRPAAGPAGAAPFLLTHGAGGDKDDEGLTALARGLTDAGHPVVRANLPYRQAGRRVPPPAERSVAAFAAIVGACAREFGGDAWVVGGKSYGGRVASLAVAAGTPAAGLLFYGYPLHPPGRPDRLRVAHWPSVAAPCCFLQGERDPFCRLDLLDAHLRKLPRRARVEIVPGGDHSLRVARAAAPDGVARGPGDILSGLAPAVAAWADGLRD